MLVLTVHGQIWAVCYLPKLWAKWPISTLNSWPSVHSTAAPICALESCADLYAHKLRKIVRSSAAPISNQYAQQLCPSASSTAAPISTQRVVRCICKLKSSGQICTFNSFTSLYSQELRQSVHLKAAPICTHSSCTFWKLRSYARLYTFNSFAKLFA